MTLFAKYYLYTIDQSKKKVKEKITMKNTNDGFDVIQYPRQNQLNFKRAAEKKLAPTLNFVGVCACILEAFKLQIISIEFVFIK